MKKKALLFFLLVIFVFNSVSVGANAVTDGIVELNLAAERYYNTNIAFADMIVSRIEEDKYCVYYPHESGKILNCYLYKTEWGTWNLGNWDITTEGTVKTIIGGNTDWEYVFRVVNPLNQNLEFTGGNHGSERLTYLSMYDSVTGETFSLEVGESKYVNRLVIEEGTDLLLGDIDYMKYAKVVRKYTFTGNTINLDCKVEFMRDVSVALSYTAMAAVNKEFSNYCMFDDGEYVVSSGKGSCSNLRMGNRPAMSCTLSGGDTSASVTVGIYSAKYMTDYFSNSDKTFLWDMNNDYNKLYFSRGNNTSDVKVKQGEVWDLGSYWRINL